MRWVNIPSELVKKGKIHVIESSTSQILHPETEISQVIGLQDALDSKEGTLVFDVTPIEDSLNPVTSGGVYTALENIDVLPDQTNNSGKLLTTDGTETSWASLDSIQEVFNVSSSTTSVTLASTLPLYYSISVYHDGLRLTKNIDYTFNTNTKTITFNRAFLNGDQVVVYVGVLCQVESLDTRTDNIHPSEKCIVNNSASGNISLDIDNAVVYSLELSGNIALSFTKDTTLGIYSHNRSFTVTLLIKNGGDYIISWPSGVNWGDGVAPTLSSGNKYDVITFITFNSGSSWLGLTSGSNYTLS